MPCLFICPAAQIRFDSMRLGIKGEESLISLGSQPDKTYQTFALDN